MKDIVDLYTGLSDKIFYNAQFMSNGYSNKNVLFVSPKPTGKDNYRYLLPYIIMNEYDIWETAITNIQAFDKDRPFAVNSALNSKMILWADVIVIPFTTQELLPIYKTIRRINPECLIVFNIDFNFYLLKKTHAYYDIFKNEDIITSVEDNIRYSDITLTINENLTKFIFEKFDGYDTGKYQDVENIWKIMTFPMFIDVDVVMYNVELKNPNKKEDTKFRIGIVATENYAEDIASFSEQINQTNELFGDKIQWVVIGFNGDYNGHNCMPNHEKVEFIKPCTIVHYYKTLRNANLDCAFIPLIDNKYNQTSEGYNKLLEFWMLQIPVISSNVYPYNAIIEHEKNGFLLHKKDDLKTHIQTIVENSTKKNEVQRYAYNYFYDTFTFHEGNIPIIDEMFNK